MSNKTMRKIGFWAASAMVVGSIIGVGVFFKNSTIVKFTNGDGISSLIAWVIGGIMSLFAAISFSEIGAMKNLRITGFAGWAEKVGGKKYGYVIRFNYSFLYMAIYATVLGLFVSEAFFEGLRIAGAIHENLYVYQHILIGLCIGVGFVIMNIASVYASGIYSQAATILKLVPIILAIVVGLIFATTNNGYKGEVGHQAFSKFDASNISGSIAAIPAVLFAFDSFLGFASMGEKTKGGEKTVRRAIIFGVIFSTVIYLILAIASLLHVAGGKNGSIENTLGQTLPSGWATGLSAFVWFFIAISATGVLNGFSAQYVHNMQESLKQDTYFLSRKLKNKFGERTTLMIYLATFVAFWTILFGVFTIAQNTDSFWDAASNIATLIFFLNYGVVILMYLLKRDKLEVTDKMKDRTFKIVSWIAVVSIFAIYGYMIFYSFSTELFMHWKEDAKGFGFYAGHQSASIQNWEYFIILWGGLAVFASFPFINKFLVHKFEKRSVYE